MTRAIAIVSLLVTLTAVVVPGHASAAWRGGGGSAGGWHGGGSWHGGGGHGSGWHGSGWHGGWHRGGSWHGHGGHGGGWRGGCCWGGWWWPGAVAAGVAFGAVAAASYYPYPYYYPSPYVYPGPYTYAAPAVAYPQAQSYPPVSYQQGAASTPAAAPTVQREVVHPNGKYVLYGDGMSQPWQWVWISAPTAQPASVPARY